VPNPILSPPAPLVRLPLLTSPPSPVPRLHHYLSLLARTHEDFTPLDHSRWKDTLADLLTKPPPPPR
jgi:hypothetical protein